MKLVGVTVPFWSGPTGPKIGASQADPDNESSSTVFRGPVFFFFSTASPEVFWNGVALEVLAEF